MSWNTTVCCRIKFRDKQIRPQPYHKAHKAIPRITDLGPPRHHKGFARQKSCGVVLWEDRARKHSSHKVWKSPTKTLPQGIERWVLGLNISSNPLQIISLSDASGWQHINPNKRSTALLRPHKAAQGSHKASHKAYHQVLLLKLPGN